MQTHEQLGAKLMRRPGVRKEVERIAPRVNFSDDLLNDLDRLRESLEGKSLQAWEKAKGRSL